MTELQKKPGKKENFVLKKRFCMRNLLKEEYHINDFVVHISFEYHKFSRHYLEFH